MASATHSTIRVYGLVLLGLALAGAGALVWQFPNIRWWEAWLVAVNPVAFLAFGWDKALARGQKVRIPEWVLHGLAVGGGVVGALLGMSVFRHKTSKRSFRVTLTLLLLAEAALLAAWLFGGLASVGFPSPWA